MKEIGTCLTLRLSIAKRFTSLMSSVYSKSGIFCLFVYTCIYNYSKSDMFEYRSALNSRPGLLTILFTKTMVS